MTLSPSTAAMRKSYPLWYCRRRKRGRGQLMDLKRTPSPCSALVSRLPSRRRNPFPPTTSPDAADQKQKLTLNHEQAMKLGMADLVASEVMSLSHSSGPDERLPCRSWVQRVRNSVYHLPDPSWRACEGESQRGRSFVVWGEREQRSGQD